MSAPLDRVTPSGAGDPARRLVLTERQRALLLALREGKTVAAAAAAVGVRRRDAHYHLERIKQQLGVGSIFELGYEVGRRGWLDEPEW